MPSATDLLRQDHNKVKGLFREFEDTEDEQERMTIAKQVFMELDIHSMVEEEIFYPAIRSQDDPGGDMEETLDEADEEHHVADLLMEELKGMRKADGKFAAKFTVLAENVKHHIGEEEAEIFPKAAEKGQQYLQDLGSQMEARKLELMQSYNGSSRRRSSNGTRKRASSKTSASRSKTSARKTKTAARKTKTAAKKSTKSAARKTKTAARKTKTASKKTARKASAAARSSGRAAKKTARKATRKAAPRKASKTSRSR